MKRNKLLLTLVSALLVVFMFTGCAGTKKEEVKTEAPKTEAPKNEEPKLEGTIAVVGSTSVQPLAQDIADAFSAKETGIKVDIQGVGSSAGIKAAIDGTADIGTSSRELKAEEKNGITEHVIAIDGIAVAVNPNNTVADLTKDQIVKIFKGEIKNWKEVGGVDKTIIVVSREAGSGTRGAFEEILKLETEKDGKKVSALIEDALIAEGNGAVKANIASKEEAIGYVSVGFVDKSIKTVKVDSVEPTVENIKAKKYSISRPFLMLTKGEIKPIVKAYLDYIMSPDGQKIVSEDYITVK